MALKIRTEGAAKQHLSIFQGLIFSNRHAPYILSADDLGDFSGILWETLRFGG